jgi:hypothetical protein
MSRGNVEHDFSSRVVIPHATAKRRNRGVGLVQGESMRNQK